MQPAARGLRSNPTAHPWPGLSTRRHHTSPRSRPARLPAGAVAAAVDNDAGRGPVQDRLPAVLDKVRAAVRGSRPLDQAKHNSNAMVFGEGVHMGLNVAWAFIWRPDGAFYEEVRSKHLTYKWGFDGGSNSHCWEVDPSGVSKVLERDDHEASLLGALIRSGNWLVPEVADRLLEMELEGNHGQPSRLEKQYNGPKLLMPPVAATWDVEPSQSAGGAAAAAAVAAAAAATGPHGPGSSSSSQQQLQLGSALLQQHNQQLPWNDAWRTPAASCSSSSSSSNGVIAGAAAVGQPPQQQQQQQDVSEQQPQQQEQPQPQPQQKYIKDLAAECEFVVLKLLHGRMLARVQISKSSWQPLSYRQPLCSDTEMWLLQDWANWTEQTQQQQQQQQHADAGPAAGGGGSDGTREADVLYPRRVVHMLFPGCAHTYTTGGAITRRGHEVTGAYQLPPCPPVPIDVQYLDTYPPLVPVWQTSQGHLLMQAHLNGRKAGWMLLDTGASGFVVEPSVADQFRLPCFGDLRIAGVAGKVTTRFRRASQLRLGPLVISDPVLMEMAVSRLVGSFHDRVIGIAGYDVFRRCSITLPCHNTRRAIRKASSSAGRVAPYDADLLTPPAVRAAAHPWPPTPQQQAALQGVLALQQDLAAAVGAGGSGHASSRVGGAAAAAAAATAVAPAPSGRRRSRRSSSSSSSSSSAAVVGAAKRKRSGASLPRPSAAAATAVLSAPAADHEQQQEQQGGGLRDPLGAAAGLSSSHLQQQGVLFSVHDEQQQQQQAEVAPVPVPPLDYWVPGEPLPPSNTLIEVLLSRPVIRGPAQLQEGYVWQEVVMIASLPHVELEFVVPGQPGKRHKSLFLVDTGAGGAEVMFHSRAARELGLLDLPPDDKHAGWGKGHAQQRYVNGVSTTPPQGASPPRPPSGSAAAAGSRTTTSNSTSTSTSSSSSSSSSTPPQPQARLSCQAGQLPELVIRGQAGGDPGAVGALSLSDVRALFNTSGGLDISLYSAGMVCADLLSRMQVVLDYPNKRIGWKVPPPGAVRAHQQ